MIEVKAIRKFEHGGTRRTGDTFKVGNKRQADALEARGLVEIVGEAKPDPAGNPPAFSPDLLDRNAPDVIAWAGDVGDPAQLKAALSVEKSGKGRKGVIKALESALAD